MSTQHTGPITAQGYAAGGGRPAFPTERSLMIATAVAVIMVVLAMLGVGLTTTSRPLARAYWFWLVPVYGLLCVATAWARSGRGAVGFGPVVRQVVHWLAVAAALWIDFLVRGAGEETAVAAGYNALLLLALGCFLAGVHLEPLFAVVGLVLTATLLVVVRAEQYLWVVVVIGVAAVAAIVAALWVRRRAARAAAGPSTPAGS
jgi:hypothetical protein